MVDQPIWLKFVQAYFVFGDKVCPVEKALNDCTDGTAFGQTFVAVAKRILASSGWQEISAIRPLGRWMMVPLFRIDVTGLSGSQQPTRWS